MPPWLLGLGPLVLIAIVLGLFTLLNAPGLNRLSEGVPPKEEVAVEDVRLTPGQIAITVRNEGPDPVSIAQVNVSDYYAMFTQTRETMAPLESTTLTISYHWVDGDPYEVALVTSNGGKIPAEIEAAALSPERGGSFFALMTLLGVYVGVIPVALGMLWMPFVRRAPASWVRVLLGVTVGLLAFLAIDATLEAMELVAGQQVRSAARWWCSSAPRWRTCCWRERTPGCAGAVNRPRRAGPQPFRRTASPC